LIVNLLSPHPVALTRPSISEVLQIKERTPTLSPSDVFTFGLAVESIKELGVCQKDIDLGWVIVKTCLYVLPTNKIVSLSRICYV
jgi:hypothetical protein